LARCARACLGWRTRGGGKRWLSNASTARTGIMCLNAAAQRTLPAWRCWHHDLKRYRWRLPALALGFYAAVDFAFAYSHDMYRTCGAMTRKKATIHGGHRILSIRAGHAALLHIVSTMRRKAFGGNMTWVCSAGNCRSA
jgi:hypothetical protein